MRKVPNDMVTTLLRCLPVILENVDASKGSTKLLNAIRLTKKEITKLQKIEQDGKQQQRTENQCGERPESL